MKQKAIEVIEGKWLRWKRFERWVCCDCSLVHFVEFRKHKGEMQVRMYRENRSTAAYRREHGIKVVCKADGTNRNASRKQR